jgi:thiamine biosynthesis lipoprotein
MLARVGSCLVDAGGDLSAGSAPTGLPGWPVAIASPGSGEAEDLLQLWLAEATLATSGIDFRRWQHNGRPAHHLIDPRSGLPAATDLLTVSVLAAEATEAEGWATAALVAGRSQGYALLAARSLPALLVTQDGSMLATPAMASFVPAAL